MTYCIHNINNKLSLNFSFPARFLVCIQGQGMFVFPSGQSSFAVGLIHFTSPAVRAPHMGPHCTPIYETWAIFTNKKQPAQCIFFLRNQPNECLLFSLCSAAFTATLLPVALAFLITDCLHTQSTHLSIS